MGDSILMIDVLRAVIQLLGGISVPRYLNGQIGLPIDEAIGSLQACVDAMEKQDGGEADGNAGAE